MTQYTRNSLTVAAVDAETSFHTSEIKEKLQFA